MTVPIDVPNEYATPGLHRTTPGADWFIDGVRFNEVSRSESPTGTEQVRLRLAAATP